MFKVVLIVMTIGSTVTVEHVPFNRLGACKAALHQMDLNLVLAGGWLKIDYPRPLVYESIRGKDRLVLWCEHAGKPSYE